MFFNNCIDKNQNKVHFEEGSIRFGGAGHPLAIKSTDFTESDFLRIALHRMPTLWQNALFCKSLTLHREWVEHMEPYYQPLFALLSLLGKLTDRSPQPFKKCLSTTLLKWFRSMAFLKHLFKTDIFLPNVGNARTFWIIWQVLGKIKFCKISQLCSSYYSHVPCIALFWMLSLQPVWWLQVVCW